MNLIPKKQAIDFVASQFPLLNLDEKTIMNWAQAGKECEPIKEKGRIYFSDDSLKQWIQRIHNSFVILTKEDYLRCIKFAIEAYYVMTPSHFDRSQQRDAGQVLTNQTSGKLGEIALAKLMEKQGVLLELDFDVRGQIPSQDIKQISTRRDVWDLPGVKVSIKTTKLKNVLLTVQEKEAILPDRKSDIYVSSHVGLFPNHILRWLKQFGENDLDDLSRIIPDFVEIPARIAGWATYAQLTAKPVMSSEATYREFNVSMVPSYILRTGELSTDWEKLKDTIIGR